MKEKSLRRRRVAISRKETNAERELNKLERELVKELCLKGYKTECDPAYCIFRYTDTCPFLKKWREISKGC